MSGGEVVEQVIRPTGLVDPLVRVEPARGQVPALLEEVKKRAVKGERVLVTTLTKRLAEDLTGYLKEQGLRCKWLHSELDAIERVTILRELREGAFDTLVGVNLLREGLDLPEVSMVCILDADKEGFLRSETSLIQTIGRSARHINAEVVLYADKVTPSMQSAMDETERRARFRLRTMPSGASHRKRSRRRFVAESTRRSRLGRSFARLSAGTRRRAPTRNSWLPSRPRCSKPPRSWSLSGRRPCAIASRTSAPRPDVERHAPPPAPRRKKPAARPGRGQAGADKANRTSKIPNSPRLAILILVVDHHP